MPVTTYTQRQATAWHEAGHALACLTLGVPIRRASIEDSCVIHASTRTVPGKRAVISAAGPLAELTYTGARYADAVHHFSQDIATLRTACEEKARGSGLFTAAEFQQRAWAQARQIITTHWSDVAAIAHGLLQHGELDDEDVADLIRRL